MLFARQGLPGSASYCATGLHRPSFNGTAIGNSQYLYSVTSASQGEGKLSTIIFEESEILTT